MRIVVDPSRPKAYAASFNLAKVTILDTVSQSIEAEIPLARRPTGLAVTPDGALLFVAGEGGLVSIDLATRTVLPPIAGIEPRGARAVAVTTDGISAWVTGLDDASVGIVDVASSRLVGTICVDSGPFALALAPEPSAATAWITAPLDGTKVHTGTSLPVAIVARGGGAVSTSWSLSILASGGEAIPLASGTAEVNGAVVAEVDRGLVPDAGGLALEVENAAGDRATTRIDLVASDPPYALMPIDPQNRFGSVDAPVVDGSGRLVVYETPDSSGEIALLDVDLGIVERIYPDGSGPWRLSRDASTLVYTRDSSALAFLDLASQATVFRPYLPLGEIDRGGQRMTFLDYVPGAHDDSELRQVFLYDRDLLELRQVTTFDASSSMRGRSTPVISGDGATVAFGANRPFHVYAYDVASRELRDLAVLMSNAPFDRPSISHDGRWLAFVTRTAAQPDLFTGVVVDLTTGAFEPPIPALEGFRTVDTVITADGRYEIISAAADLDPAVGNADGNTELFRYDRQSGAFTQITDTVGQTPVAYSPSVNHDGAATAFFMQQAASGVCPAVGPQRDAVSGFNFGRTYSVRRRAANRPPVLAAVADVRLRTDELLDLHFSATDPDGERIAFFLQLADGIRLPQLAYVVDGGDGTAEFSWRPAQEDVGDHLFRLGAFDSGGAFALEKFSVRVCRAFLPDGACAPTPTATAMRSDTPSATVTASRSASATRTPTASASPSVTKTAPPSPTATRTPTATVTQPASSPTETSTATPMLIGSGGCRMAPQAQGSWTFLLAAFCLLMRRAGISARRTRGEGSAGRRRVTIATAPRSALRRRSDL